MKKIIIIFSFSLFLSISISFSPNIYAQTNNDWYMAGANPQRTSWANYEGPTNLQMEAVIPLEAYIDQHVQVIGANNMVYLSTAKGLLAFDANISQYDPNNPLKPWIKWRFDTEMPLGHSPTVVNGVVYVAGFDRKLYALDATTGALRWTYIGAEAGYDTNPLVINDTNTHNNPIIILGNRDGKIYAIGADNHPSRRGQLLWTYDTGGSVSFSPAYKDGTLYFANNNNFAYALNITDTNASLKWKKLIIGDSYSSYWPVIYKNKVIFTISKFQKESFDTVGSTKCIFSIDTPWPAAMEGSLPGEILPATSWSDGFSVLRPTNIFECLEDNPDNDPKRHRPDNRMTVILDRETGEEFTLDADGDGFSEYLPSVHFHTNSGNQFPAIVRPDGNIMYFGTYLQCCSDAKGKVYGWNIDDPDKLSMVGSGLAGDGRWYGGGRGALAEPQALSGAGSIIYRNIAVDRTGDWFKITSTNPLQNGFFWDYSNSLGHHVPGYDQDSWVDIPSGMSRLFSYFQGYKSFYENWNVPGVSDNEELDFHSINGVYQNSGIVNALIPYNGRIYSHRSNTLVVFGPSGNNYSTKKYPLVPINNTYQSSGSSLTSDQLKSRLDREIEKILESRRVTGKFLRPAYYIMSQLSYKHDYYASPADNLYTLSVAYKQISDHLKSELAQYIRDYVQTYYINERPTTTGWLAGAPRESLQYPKGFAQAITNNDSRLAPLIGREDGLVGFNYSPFHIYALWKYVQNIPGVNISQIYSLAKSALDPEIPIRQTFCYADHNSDGIPERYNRSYEDFHYQYPYELNSHLAGYYGFIALHNLAASQGVAVDSNFLTQVQTALNDNQNFKRVNFSKDTYYVENKSIDPNCPMEPYRFKHKELDIAKNFMWFTPELGNYLSTASYPNILNTPQKAVEEYQYVAPYWFVARYDAAIGETVRSPLWNYPALFQAKAWILKEPREELTKYLDVPAFEKGDLSYIQNLVVALEAGPAGPTPTPYQHCQPLGNLDCSGTVSVMDLSTLLSKIGSSDLIADLDNSGIVNILDLSILLSNFGK